ncbi:MAG TPA: LysR family transcriptional regulator [Xanthobacteraceae bacterium]|jgi:DNA-binding transcriptional LysR family regulator|nr:LysR family transcriptional regulator [Xanthobacteraceae bacterium]
MDLRHARTFVTVAELGTVSKAALQLRIAQPALSRQINALERELGIKLFDRIGRRLLLTSAGEQLLGDCRGLLNYAGAIGEHAQALQRGDVGVLKVGASPQHIESVQSMFLHRYAKHYPNVQVKLIEAAGRDTMAMLERREIHLGQNLAPIIGPDDRRFGSLPLQHVDLLVACDPGLDLGEGATVDIGRLAPHRLLVLDSSFVFRRTFDAACRLADIRPNIFMESHAPHTLLALAEAGHGVAIIPSQLRADHYRLRILAVTYRGRRLRTPMVILWDKQRPRPRYATAYCAMLADYVREIFPITRPSKPA